jgi:hypothetical protein
MAQDVCELVGGPHVRLVDRKRDRVASEIYRAAVFRRNLIYVPRIWRLLMAALHAIPECIFKWMNL